MTAEEAEVLLPTDEVDEASSHLVALARKIFGHVETFEVQGRPYVAISQECWADQGASSRCDRRLLCRVAGRIVISGKRHVVLDCAGDGVARGPNPSLVQVLTRRELQIALLVGEGGGDKDIARDLGISTYTVREHIRRIFNKLGVAKRSAVVARLLTDNLSIAFLVVSEVFMVCWSDRIANAVALG